MTPADSYLSPRWLMFQPQEVHAFLGDLSPAISDQLESWRKRLNDSRLPLLHRMRNLDVATYLPGAVLTKVDRMSMQVSLEVRSPLLDLRVARFAQTASAATCWQPPDDTKRILKGLAGKYLPESWMRRKKMGFGLPSNAWSREAILEFAKELLLSPSGHLIGLIDRATLQRHILRQTQPGSFSVYQMWPLLILELWLRKVHITGSGPD
jgi:asparagine synthase (glutamine-hydrolysing)